MDYIRSIKIINYSSVPLKLIFLSLDTRVMKTFKEK